MVNEDIDLVAKVESLKDFKPFEDGFELRCVDACEVSRGVFVDIDVNHLGGDQSIYQQLLY